MRDVQPPIIDDEELQGYRAALTILNDELAIREADVFNSRTDAAKLERARNALFRMYGKRQGIIDAIAAYEQKKQATA